VQEQPAEALTLEHAGRDPAALVGDPQLRVDGAIGREDRGRERQVEAPQRVPQGDALGAIRVEERMVEIEEYGPDRQGSTSRDT
jgi:hypothetical protein